MADLSHLVNTSRDPAYEYGNLLPFRKPLAGGPAEWNLGYSGLVKGIADAFAAPGRAASGEMLSPEEAINFGMNFTGGGLALGRVPEASLGMAARGMKRVPPMWHGTKPDLFESILQEGLLQGRSAELKLPGSSLSRDPHVSMREEFIGQDMALPGAPRETQVQHFVDYLRNTLLQAKLDVPPEQIANLRPSEYISGVVPAAPAYNKPNKFWNEKETFVLRNKPEQINELIQRALMDSFDPEALDVTVPGVMGIAGDHNLLSSVIQVPQMGLSPTGNVAILEKMASALDPESQAANVGRVAREAFKQGSSIPVKLSQPSESRIKQLAEQQVAFNQGMDSLVAAHTVVTQSPAALLKSLDAARDPGGIAARRFATFIKSLRSFKTGPEAQEYISTIADRRGDKIAPFWKGVFSSDEKWKAVEKIADLEDKLFDLNLTIGDATAATQAKHDPTAGAKLDAYVKDWTKLRDQMDKEVRTFLSTPLEPTVKIKKTELGRKPKPQLPSGKANYVQ